MQQHSITEGGYGPGTYVDTSYIPVPQDARRLLKYMAEITPGFTKDQSLLDEVQFEGDDMTFVPGPGKSQVFSSVLHAMAGIVGKEILELKGHKTGSIKINTDQAGLYPAAVAIFKVDRQDSGTLLQDGAFDEVWTDLQKDTTDKTPGYYRTWSIYPTATKDVSYQFMGSLNPGKLLRAFDIDPDTPFSSKEEAYEFIKSVLIQYSPAELELKCLEGGFCGQICYTPAAWRKTQMAKSLERHPLVNYHQQTETVSLPKVPFPDVQDQRPLAGIKVVELARIIAGPAMGAALASFGADLVRIQSPNLPDLNSLQLTLTAGKRTCALDLTKPDDVAQLHKLISEADVVIQAYRLGALKKKGFGLEDILEMANKRGKGIVYIDLNCYGPDGYYAERPGWQQIADAASGCSYVFGKAYKNPDDVAVLPPLPIADMLAGATGLVAALLALRDRAKLGGSYHSCISLTAVDTIQLSSEFGLYQHEIVSALQEKHKFGPMKPEYHVQELLFNCIEAWGRTTDLLDRPEFYAAFEESSPFGKNHEILAPIVRYENGEATPHWTSPPVPFCHHLQAAFAQS